MLELDLGQNTKVVGNILKYLCVKIGDVMTSFARVNPYWKLVENNRILPHWNQLIFWPILITFYTPYATLSTTKLQIQ